MKSEALSQLAKFIEKTKWAKSKVEQEIGIPENNLSGYLNGTKEMPTKYVEIILNYLSKYPEFAPKPIIPETILSDFKVSEKGLQEISIDDKNKNLKAVMDKINKDFGPGSCFILGDKPIKGIEAISTGSVGLDAAIGIGGLPRGRIVEIYGAESSGKTTIAIHVIAEAQKKGLRCAIIDAEHAFDTDYASNLGVDINHLNISQPQWGEEGLEIADRLIESKEFGVVVIDSVAALVPKGELEGEMGDSKMGLHARLMSQACRKMVASISKTNTLCIFINQLREKIGVVWGPTEITTGGNALKFYSSVRLDVRRSSQLKDGDEAYGNRIKVKVVKNKVAPPFKSAEFDILYGEGINKVGEILDIAVQKNIINKSGSWYSYNDTKLGQGRDSATSLLKDNEELLSEIEGKIKDQ